MARCWGRAPNLARRSPTSGGADGRVRHARRRPDAALVLAEAGTGTGKTLGYLAPATLWAKNGAPVWISTYTRTLQHQIASELTRLYPDPNDWARKVVIREGASYLCLLNLEEALGQLAGAPARHRAGSDGTLGRRDE